MTHIKDQSIQDPALEVVLLAVGLNAGLALSTDLSPVDIAAHSHGSEVCTGHQERSCTDKGVVHKFSGPAQGLVGHDQRELCIHGGVANVFPLLDIELFDQLALSVSNLFHIIIVLLIKTGQFAAPSLFILLFVRVNKSHRPKSPFFTRRPM